MAVVILTENEEEREKTNAAIESEMNDQYDIKMPNPADLRLKVIGMSFQYDEKECLKKLKKRIQILATNR